MTARRYVITGCAASGTKWASQVWTALGGRCTHQKVFRVLGMQPWGRSLGDSSFFAIGQMPDSLPTLRIVRNPLHVARSLEQMSGFLTRDTADDALTFDYIGRHSAHIVEPADRLGRILRYIAYWDDIDADRTLLVDRASPAQINRAFRATTGRQATRPIQVTLRQIGSGVNTHYGLRSTLAWVDIADHPDGEPVIRKARQFGYDTTGLSVTEK